MSSEFLNNDDNNEFQNIELIKEKLLKLKNEDNDINDVNNIIENNKEETIELKEDEDDDFSFSNKIDLNSEYESEKEKEDNSKIINIYKRHYENKSTMKKKINFYKKSYKKTILKRKEYYVHQLLQRWWYALPPWPPENLDINDKLKENKLRLVEEKIGKKKLV